MPFCDAEGWTVFSQSRILDFTLCFQDSILTLISNVILLVILTPRIHKVVGKGRLVGVQASALFYFKMLLVMASVAIQAAILVKIVSNSNYQSSALMSTILYLLGLVGAGTLHWFEYFNIANPSAVLLVYWLFTALISIFPTRSWIQIAQDGISSPLPLLKLLFTIVSFLIFAIENIPKPNRSSLARHNAIAITQSNPSPETQSNYFARVSFFWLVPLLRQGKKKALKMEDLYSLHPKLLSYPLYLTTKAKIDADEAIALQKIKNEEEKGVSKDSSKTLKGHINLLGTLLHTVGYSFLAAVFPRLLYICTYYLRPILFSKLIDFISTYSESSIIQGVKPQAPWIGFGLLIAVFASGMLSSLFNNQFTFICYNASIKARGVLVNLIYRKALNLSSTDKQEGMGSIVNHMSTDVDNVMEFFNVTHLSWSSIVEVGVVTALLYNEVRYAMFASIGVAFIFSSIAGFCMPHVSGAQREMMKRSDKRMKFIAELVNNIKSIKLYAWESYFIKKITEIRVEQLGMLRRLYSWLTVMVPIGNSIVPFSIFTTLAVYSAIATEDAPLDTRRLFTTITLVYMLEGPIDSVTNSLQKVFTGIVAYGRLRDFLNSEEIDDDNVLRNPDPASSEVAYEVTDGTFGWYSPKAIQASIDQKKAEKAEADLKAVKKNKSSKKAEESEKGDKGNAVEASKEESGPAPPTPESARDSMGPVLHNINLTIKRGSLTLVLGRVGEGKSSLVGALLGEMHKHSGVVQSYGSLAYVSQTAWILNDTVKNNILFGRAYDKQRYLETIRACALVPDFKVLTKGDRTVVGEKGINLSGGQKQRISIARAVYANADVYIFDDPLSAVDAHVDEHIFKNVFQSILADKTRILVTNGVNHLKVADQIVVIKQGRISEDGKYTDLIQNEQGDLFHLVKESEMIVSKAEDEKESSFSKDGDNEDDKVETVEGASAESSGDEGTVDVPTEKDGLAKRPSLKRSKSSKINEDNVIELDEIDEIDEVDEEVVAKGNVGWPVYKYYLSSIGTASMIFISIVLAIYVGIKVGIQLWQGRWGSANDKVASGSAPEHSEIYWIMTYFAWVISGTLMQALVSSIFLIFLARRASMKLHSAMLAPLVRSPMSFFDVTSSGKISNRFAHDITAVDIQLPFVFLQLITMFFLAVNIFGMCIAASPYFAIIMIPLGFGYYQLGGFYVVSSREFKRLDSAARSPLYAHFGETLAGLTTIRAFNDSSRFAIQATTLLDRSQQTSYLTNVSTRWLQIMLDFMSLIVLTVVGLLAILQRESANQQVFSIVLSQIGQLTSIMTQILSCSVSLETTIVSVERIREYSQLTPEARDVIPDSKTDESWPQRGQISFNQFSTRYREGLDLVLKDVNVTINGGERIGIVGRTGAGKSSITMALFRMIEATEGSIQIDGIDISKLGLHELRSHLTIIPQDPFLFGDSIRVNLDPFNKHTDTEIWAALESASLKNYVQTLPEGISTTIDNGGESMSLGQRQLMSLARAMLSQNTQVLCLDEATAAIDVETDNAIQLALRREFASCTVLTIAHRINTIMDNDRILVLEQGQVAEYDTPQNLLQKKDGIFYSLATKSGNA
ncbi:hypothetical protein BGX27_000627 [Mortierella sp. AM989]|nr:hypothetical protein BGX27_000627 [Mortierella sp. AM989]